MQMTTKVWAIAVLGAAALIAGPATAQTVAPVPDGVLNLSATATVDVPNDWMTVTFSTTREGADAVAVQAQIRQALDTALAEARKVAKPGQVEVSTGSFSLYPRYGNKGTLTGWNGTAELQAQGRDMPALALLSGRITTMTIAGVAYSISREAREKLEGEVAAQAIARFRASAAEHARAFGYGGYKLREVNVAHEAEARPPRPMLRARAMEAASADASLPVEAGKGAVTATVSGSVQMVK